MKKKEREMKNELHRLLRAYTFILLVILCVFGISAGVLEAKNNTRRMSFGEVVDTITWDSLFKNV
ncbi:MAG: hypothetical protein LBS36_02195 [Oscillospiraceae bacterium]|nr:hypothetical protein [Oscillospiraceae bacterium]